MANRPIGSSRLLQQNLQIADIMEGFGFERSR
jgi:hypothetical protein